MYYELGSERVNEKVDVDMLNAIKNVCNVLMKGLNLKRLPTHSLQRSVYPHQPFIDTVYDYIVSQPASKSEV